MLNEELPKLDQALAEAAKMITRVFAAGCPVEEINTGGGLGTVMGEGDGPLDLDAWATLLAHHLGGFGVTIAAEPGEFFVARAGVLL